RGLALRDTAFQGRLIPAARWARGKDIDAPLAALAAHTDDGLRRAAVEAVRWRLRKRQGAAEPLLKALHHPDEQTEFLAAEGSAKAGRGEGLNVLLAGVELLSSAELRGRAVLALGELGDTRALNLLLKLANDPEHELREPAAEAIGRLGRSARGEE